MFHAIRAALYRDGVRIPKTHAGLRNRFGQHYVATGKLPKDLGRWLGQAFRMRQQGDYEIHAELSEELVDEVVTNAAQFVETLAEYVETQREPQAEK